MAEKYPIIQAEEGFGAISEEQLVELNKALEAGYAVSSQTGGGALRVESLEGTLKVTTFSEKHCIMWQRIAKKPAFSTVEEYNELSSYGAEGNSFTPAGTLPEEDDSSYTRRTSLVKYLGTTRKVQHQMTLVQTVGGDVIARENINGTRKLIRDAEDAFFWGNSALKYGAGEGIEWDGLNVLVDAANVYDMANAELDEKSIERSAEVIADSYGDPTDMFLSNKSALPFVESLLPKGRAIYPQAGTGEIVAGKIINKVATQFGEVKLNPSKFLNLGRSPKKTVPSVATSTKAPTAPASIVGGAMAGTDGKFRAAQVGTFKFQVTACNRYGESQPCALSAGVAVGAGDVAKHIPLTITNANPVVTAPEWFNIYATAVDGTITYLVGQVGASSQANGGTTVYNYTGYIMANTSIAFIGEMSEEVLVFKQLAPLMKMDLAITDPNIRWMILLYGTLQLFAPKKFARVINIKTA